jgi:hypothetical protein
MKLCFVTHYKRYRIVKKITNSEWTSGMRAALEFSHYAAQRGVVRDRERESKRGPAALLGGKPVMLLRGFFDTAALPVWGAYGLVSPQDTLAWGTHALTPLPVHFVELTLAGHGELTSAGIGN